MNLSLTRLHNRYREFQVFGVGLVGERHHSNEEAIQREANKPEFVIYTNFTRDSAEKLLIGLS